LPIYRQYTYSRTGGDDFRVWKFWTNRILQQYTGTVFCAGFDKPPSYEHFVPALEHHGGGGGGGGGDDEDGDVEYESHKPISYSLKELPGLALQVTSAVLAESGAGQPAQQAEAMEKAESKLVGLLLQDNKRAPAVQ